MMIMVPNVVESDVLLTDVRLVLLLHPLLLSANIMGRPEVSFLGC